MSGVIPEGLAAQYKQQHLTKRGEFLAVAERKWEELITECMDEEDGKSILADWMAIKSHDEAHMVAIAVNILRSWESMQQHEQEYLDMLAMRRESDIGTYQWEQAVLLGEVEESVEIASDLLHDYPDTLLSANDAVIRSNWVREDRNLAYLIQSGSTTDREWALSSRLAWVLLGLTNNAWLRIFDSKASYKKALIYVIDSY